MKQNTLKALVALAVALLTLGALATHQVNSAQHQTIEIAGTGGLGSGGGEW